MYKKPKTEKENIYIKDTNNIRLTFEVFERTIYRY